MGKQYVQHISGQGRKWELDGDTRDEYESATEWVVKSEDGDERHFLPKSEYRLCPAPEVWKDVTDKVNPSESCEGNYSHKGNDIIGCTLGYRLSKAEFAKVGIAGPRWAFIVEERVSE